MSKHTENLSDELFALLGDTNETSAVTFFLQLLRESPNLRHWLRTAYLQPEARDRLADCLDGKTAMPAHARTGRQILSWLAGADKPRLLEIARQQTRDIEPRLHGGLTRAKIFQLIRRCQAGAIDLAPFMLALAWRNTRAKDAPGVTFHLMCGRFLDACFSEKRMGLVQKLADAVEYFRDRPVGSITRARYGYGTWWRLIVLHYILNHPKPRYRTGEFARHLASQKMKVDPKDLRRFCKKHGIARDIRPGRPSKAGSAKSDA